MKTLFRMKEATNVQEAITSILDVIEESPVWLNNINSSLLTLVRNIEQEHKRFVLEKSLDEQVIDLFVEIKTEYYKFQDNNY
tara:strand:- start:302 stop:547 length:246 start_codon:yes stop_codon:yes gene_type:complete